MRCNNHICVKTPLWRGDLIWSWLDLLICRFMLDVKSRSWLILVQVPFCTFDCEKCFTPPPLTFISHSFHFFYTYSYDTFISRTGILWAKEPPSTLPTRIDSCPLFLISWYGWVIWIPYPIVTVEPIQFEVWPFHWRSKFFELRFLKRIRHRETTPTPFDGGHEPKIQPLS